MVTVIIPALNEEKTIAQVIRIVKRSSSTSEIIVIDDKSTDNTVQEAIREHVRVFTSSKRGKGTSMMEGIMLASHDIIAFVDADITTYPDDVIDRLTRPIINQEADFVKSYFDRQAGRVTELVAKPLLKFLFPSISHFRQPLSGMIAGKKAMFEKLMIDEDYGVDIGILIDMHRNGARIQEVSLGYIENRMQTIPQLVKMSSEVTKAILQRSGQLLEGTIDLITGKSFQTNDPQIDFALKENKNHYRQMAIFDMDRTLLLDSFIHTLARKRDFTDSLSAISAEMINPFLRIKKIARLLRGISLADILKTADEIPLVEDSFETIRHLKQKGYLCGIISESYDVVTNHIANKLGMHFSLANELIFSKSRATGEVIIPSFFLPARRTLCNHDYCKSHAVEELCRRFEIDIKNTIAVGNGRNDICMIRNAGIGVSFCTENKVLGKISDYNIQVPEFRELTELTG